MIFKIGEGYLQKSVILAHFYLRKNAKNVLLKHTFCKIFTKRGVKV